MTVRLEIDPADGGVPHAAPLSRAMEQTAALDIIDRPTPREPRAGSEWHSLDSVLVGVSTTALGTVHGPGSTTPLLARGLEPAGPTSIEDLWSLPTGDIAALVAEVRAKLAEVRRHA